MNYRHIYHAGNFADVFKHLLLTRALNHLNKKQKPYMVMDTHGGIGRYDLVTEEAQKTNEFIAGIHRLMADGHRPPFTEEYLTCVESVNHSEQLAHYPGSPWIAQSMMRHGDRLIVCELHKTDAETLKANLVTLRSAAKLDVLAPQDGYKAISAKLPPNEKRGLVLIDPPFEQPDEFDQVINALVVGLKRWQSGSFAVWFPIKDPVKTAQFYDAVTALTGAPKTLLIELMVRTASDEKGLSGCGFVWINPPFGLVNELDQLLPYLTQLLAQDSGASSNYRWLIEESG